MSESKIGLQMYTVRDFVKTPEQYKETLKKIAEIGYSVIQTKCPAFFTETEYVALLQQYGLKADSVYVSAKNAAAEVDGAARLAELYGCTAARTNSIPDQYTESAEGYREYAKILNHSGRLCRDAGLRMMYHFHAFEWRQFGNERGIDILLNETDPDCVFFQPDVFWLTQAGTEPSRSLKLFQNRAFFLHVKDYAITTRKGEKESVPSMFAPVGTGNLHWDAILRTAEEMQIERFVVEQDKCHGDVWEAVRISLENLHAMGLR